ncbi:hypothetical protein [Bradyrhizobium sp. ARR65]|uniref:hypothetical protein n=1 Tax=Bradyrhizobium sp. ARR65 TaxID=1040989 RepID=UPI000466014C|nr:hypothetical protein [Bradyrhizobium sp. ARR65]
MLGEGDDAGHCSSAFNLKKIAEATSEERATYRKWLRGVVAFYCMLLLAVCAIAFATSNTGPTTQLGDAMEHHASVKNGPERLAASPSAQPPSMSGYAFRP